MSFEHIFLQGIHPIQVLAAKGMVVFVDSSCQSPEITIQFSVLVGRESLHNANFWTLTCFSIK